VAPWLAVDPYSGSVVVLQCPMGCLNAWSVAKHDRFNVPTNEEQTPNQSPGMAERVDTFFGFQPDENMYIVKGGDHGSLHSPETAT
jgi:hypothetical protein